MFTSMIQVRHMLSTEKYLQFSYFSVAIFVVGTVKTYIMGTH